MKYAQGADIGKLLVLLLIAYLVLDGVVTAVSNRKLALHFPPQRAALPGQCYVNCINPEGTLLGKMLL